MANVDVAADQFTGLPIARDLGEARFAQAMLAGPFGDGLGVEAVQRDALGCALGCTPRADADSSSPPRWPAHFGGHDLLGLGSVSTRTSDTPFGAANVRSNPGTLLPVTPNLTVRSGRSRHRATLLRPRFRAGYLPKAPRPGHRARRWRHGRRRSATSGPGCRLRNSIRPNHHWRPGGPSPMPWPCRRCRCKSGCSTASTAQSSTGRHRPEFTNTQTHCPADCFGCVPNATTTSIAPCANVPLHFLER